MIWAMSDIILLIFGHEVTGEVIRQEQRWKRDDNGEAEKLYYRAVVLIRTDDGYSEILAKIPKTSPVYPTGSKVTVLYLPGHPWKAYIEQEIKSNRGVIIFLLFFGSIILSVAIFGMFSCWWRGRLPTEGKQE